MIPLLAAGMGVLILFRMIEASGELTARIRHRDLDLFDILFYAVAAPVGLIFSACLISMPWMVSTWRRWIAQGADWLRGEHNATRGHPARESREAPTPPDVTWSQVWPWLVAAGVLLVIVVAVQLAKPSIAANRKARQQATAAEKARWTRLEQTYVDAVVAHNKVTQAYAHYLLDLDELIDLPSLADVTTPATAAFIESMASLNQAEMDSFVHDEQQVLLYAKTASDAALAWTIAYQTAQKIGQTQFSHHQRQDLQLGRHLLTKATASGTTPEERASYRSKGLAKLQGLISLPTETLTAIEGQTRAAITARAA